LTLVKKKKKKKKKKKAKFSCEIFALYSKIFIGISNILKFSSEILKIRGSEATFL